MNEFAPAVRAPLVGRERELGFLLARLEHACSGQGGIVLLGGEPGIGKTRLAEELASTAEHRGVKVAWGRCIEVEGAPAFWPWLELLREIIRDDASPSRPAETGTAVSDLAALMLEGAPFRCRRSMRNATTRRPAPGIPPKSGSACSTRSPRISRSGHADSPSC